MATTGLKADARGRCLEISWLTLFRWLNRPVFWLVEHPTGIMVNAALSPSISMEGTTSISTMLQGRRCGKRSATYCCLHFHGCRVKVYRHIGPSTPVAKPIPSTWFQSHLTGFTTGGTLDPIAGALDPIADEIVSRFGPAPSKVSKFLIHNERTRRYESLEASHSSRVDGADRHLPDAGRTLTPPVKAS